MADKNKIEFKWKENQDFTEKYKHISSEFYTHTNDKKYFIKIFKIRDSFAVSLHEDDYEISMENTQNITFKECVDVSKPVQQQILNWATNIVSQNIGKCEICRGIKIVRKLTLDDLEKEEFKGFEKICKKCRSDIYDIRWEKFRKEIEAEHKKRMQKLKKRPPIIIGPFKKEIEAYRFLRHVPNPDREEIDKCMIFCKGILKAKDGSYYPVFLTIEIPGGEHWDTGFIADNYDEVISQDLVFPFINKTQEEIFPYTYQSLCFVEDDFHQKTRFGEIHLKSVKHSHTNQIKFEGSENWEEIEESIHVEVRSYFSIQHILSASLFFKQVSILEKSLNLDCDNDDLVLYKSYIVSIIFSCVCFLESTINELFMDASENPEGIVKGLNKENIKMLSSMWSRGIPRTASYNIIEKYQVALTLTKKRELDLGISIVQDVSILIKLRNALTHFEPETVITKSTIQPESIKIQKLEKQIKGKFELNSFVGENNLFFPDKCLSKDCALWAIRSAMNFVDYFYDEMELIPNHQLIRYKIEKNINIATNID